MNLLKKKNGPKYFLIMQNQTASAPEVDFAYWIKNITQKQCVV
jgi:hypothetical protein